MPNTETLPEIEIIFDLDELTLELGGNRGPIAFGDKIVWNFQAKQAGRPAAFPPGVVPLVCFDVKQKRKKRKRKRKRKKRQKRDGTQYLGPFESLTQVLEQGENGDQHQVHGSGRTTREGGTYEYYVFLQRGLGGEDHAANFALLCSPKLTLELEPAAALPLPREPIERNTITFEVVKEGQELKVKGAETKVWCGDVVEWDFSKAGPGFPLVLFYRYQPKGAPQSQPNVHFGPCHSMSFEGQKVIGGAINTMAGYYDYEAALFSVTGRSVTMISSGDPRIDNQGEPP